MQVLVVEVDVLKNIYKYYKRGWKWGSIEDLIKRNLEVKTLRPLLRIKYETVDSDQYTS